MKKLLMLGTVSAAVLASASPAKAAGVDLKPVLDGLGKFLAQKGAPPPPAPPPPPTSAAAPPTAQPAAQPAVPAPMTVPLPELPPLPQSAPPPIAETLDAVAVAPERRVMSTAYCLTGSMASGKPVYDGAAAMNGVPLGTKFRVLDGPRAGEVLTVEDRLPRGSALDIAYPGRCGEAHQYGRRSIRISQVAG